MKNNGGLSQGPNESENEPINKESDQLDENENIDHISNGNPAEPDTNKQEREVQAENITGPVLTSNGERLNAYDHETSPKVVEEQKTIEEEEQKQEQTIKEISEITNNNNGQDGGKPEEKEIASDYIEDNVMKGDHDIVDKADNYEDEQPHDTMKDNSETDNTVPPEEQIEDQKESEEQLSEPGVESSAELEENPLINEEDEKKDNAQKQNNEENPVAVSSDRLNDTKSDYTESSNVNNEHKDRAQNYENTGDENKEGQKERQKEGYKEEHKEEQSHDTRHSDLVNSNSVTPDEELLQILKEAGTSFKNTTHQKINGLENCEENDPNEEEKEEVKNEFDPEINSNERIEEVQIIETNNSDGQEASIINIEENSNSCETQVELNNKAFITQI